MSRTFISSKQAVCMIILTFIGTAALFVGTQANKGIWIAFIIALAAGSLFVLVYARLLSVLPLGLLIVIEIKLKINKRLF